MGIHGGRWAVFGRLQLVLAAVGTVVVAGWLACAACAAPAPGGQLTWLHPRLVDGNGPFGPIHSHFNFGVSCPTSSLCAAIDENGDIVTSTAPGNQHRPWVITHVEGGPIPSFRLDFGCLASITQCLSAISCPSASLCVAVDGQGDVLTSIDPAGGAGTWKITNVHGTNGIESISCPSVSLCVAVDQKGNVLSSTNPTGGRAAWASANVDGTNSFFDVSCASGSLCVAVDENGHVITSTKPNGGASAWKAALIDGGNELVGVSCTVASLCVIVDANGDPVVSTNPTGGATAWKITRLNVAGTFDASVYCQSRSLCFLSDENGDVRTATNPIGRRTSWRRTARRVNFHELSCWSRSRCVAASGKLLISANPTGFARSWRVANVPRDGLNSLDAVSCPSRSLCVAGDSFGRLVTSRTAAAGSPAWRVTSVNLGHGIGGVSCFSTRSCVGIASTEGSTQVLLSRNPARGRRAWSRVSLRIPVTKQFGAPSVSCPSRSVCVAIDSADELLVSTAAAHRKWRATGLDSDPSAEAQPALAGVSCPSESLCVAVDNAGRTFASATPTRGGWSAKSIDPSSSLQSISCPTTSFCAAVDEDGNVAVSSHPLGGRSAWALTKIDGTNTLTGISCVSSSFCVAVDAAGNALTSSNPSAGAIAWTATPIDRATSPVSVSCASNTLCVAGDAAGRVVVGRA